MIEKLYNSVGGSKKKIVFVVYVIIILVSAFFVSDVLVRGWEDGRLLKVIFQHAPFILLGISVNTVGAVLFGIYTGLLILLNIDPKKRWQGRFLAIGTIIAVVGMQTQGVFEISFVEAAPWFVGGIIAGLIVGGGTKLIENQTAQALEFRRAATVLSYILTIVTLTTFAEAHLTYPSLFEVQYFPRELSVSQWVLSLSPPPESVEVITESLYTDIAATGVFLFTLRRFIKYDAEMSFFIIGPSESGKTLFLIGAYLEALESYSGDNNGLLTTPMNPTQDLMQMLDEFDQSREEWTVGATGAGEVRDLGFRYVHGQVFPLNVYITALDYAGEHLPSIPDVLSGVLEIDDYPNPAILRALVQNVQQADTLVLMLDIERFVTTEQSLEISEYFDLLQAVDDKDVVLVATKSDLLAEEFIEETGLQPVRHYDEFVDYVNNYLSENQQIEALITETGGTNILPVYYQTRVTETGERVPMRDETNSVMIVGFNELLDKLGS